MSTDTRRGRARARRGRSFTLALTVVLVALGAAGLVGAVVTTAQGPRVTDVQFDPDAAVEASGSRVIVTTTQSLAEVDPGQVTVTPAVDFTVDTSGRSVGIRFAVPLFDDTEYTVQIEGLESVGGGPTATVSETFTTPGIDAYLLRRGTDDGDVIFRTDMAGENATPVFTHPHIEDYRATATHLVVSVRTDDDRAGLIAMALDGSDQRTLLLPGDGVVSNLQSADRGDLIGYTFSDADLDAGGGLESVLFTASLKDAAATDEPTMIEVEGADPRVAEWRFVPGTDSILMLSFDGSMLLTGSSGQDATSLGNALGIEGIARGSSIAIVDRAEGLDTIDLTDASEEPLVEAQDLGPVNAVTPVPDGGSVRTAAVLDASGLPSGSTVAAVDAHGASRVLLEVPASDGVIQTCVSPSGRYAAVVVAPDSVDNAYDQYLLPMPRVLETNIVEISDGAPVVALTGFAPSWCQVPAG